MTKRPRTFPVGSLPDTAGTGRWLRIMAVIALVASGCGDPDQSGSTGLTTMDPTSTSILPAPASSTVTTTPPIIPALLPGLAIDDEWTLTEIQWGAQPAGGDAPAIGSASPDAPLPDDRINPDAWGTDAIWPVDGFYDVIVTRVWDPPGVVRMAIRHWVPCAQLPDRCPVDPPANGIVADPATEVVATVFLDALTVVIQPIQTWKEGVSPDPPVGITGSGWAFYELLSGWCSGYLPEPNPANCGLDHAFIDWIWDPHQAGASINDIIEELEARSADPTFPLGLFDDHSTDAPCSNDRRCPIAYRGPQETNLIVDFGLLDVGGDWPTELYGWWTTLEVRNGKPILYIDAGRLAG